jgi:formate hydrogenlyase transcriptional activator
MTSSFQNGALERLQALLEVSQAIARHRDIAPLLEAISPLLHPLIDFDDLEILLFDARTDHVSVFRSPTSPPAGGNPDKFLIEDGPGGWVWENQRTLIVETEELHTRFPTVAVLRDAEHIAQSCVVPLTTCLRRVGVIEFLSVRTNTYSEEDTEFIQYVASLVAVAIDNALHCESARAAQERLRILLDTTNIAVSARTLDDLVANIFVGIQQLCGATCCGLVLRHESMVRGEPKVSLHLETVHPAGDNPSPSGEQSWPMEGPFQAVFDTGRPTVIRKSELEHLASPMSGLVNIGKGLSAVCCLPLSARGRVFGALNICHTDADAFSGSEVEMLMEIAGQVSTSTDNTRAYQEIVRLRDQLTREKRYLEEEIHADHNFEEIVGKSAALKAVLEQVRLVAPLDSSVLLLGETGTGKELVARAIHALSKRNSRPLIKVNCAAIPAGLLESELFGHEKGSFTGAFAQKIGRFELAHQGTIFLDEIGEISYELQPKLLRALQEREFERVGGNRSIRVDVRIIAATNQKLEQMIAEQKFRRDLFYRLNVFPIIIPPLRERQGDIPPLVWHFVQKFSSKMRRNIDVISDQTMDTLCRAQWTGNVRELENFIERAVILTQGNELTLPLVEIYPEPACAQESAGKPEPILLKTTRAAFEAAKREQILHALRETNGIVSGPRGAAKMLGVKRTTLHALMRRLGISRES